MENLPGYLSWFGIEQILWLCSKVMNFIYSIVPNVGVSVILYAFFSHILFIPFSIKKGIDEKKDKKVNGEILLLTEEFNGLPQEEREKEEVKEEFRKRKKEIQKKKSSTGVGCLVMMLRIFVLLAAMPVISHMDHFVGPSPESYNFLGFNLLEIPGYNLTLSLIFPIITTLILVIPGLISTKMNIEEQKALREKKSKEEREEEEKLLKEMGMKDNKIPLGYIVQLVFGVLYFHTFSHINLALSLYWSVYYLIGFGLRRVIEFGLSKSS